MGAPSLDDLDAAQRRAVEHAAGPLRIVAGAGTGKTRTLVARVADLVHRGIDPERILLLTFSRRAAREMLARAAATGGDDRVRRVRGGTFHAVGLHVLARHGQAVGLPPTFSVLDAADASDLLGAVRADLGVVAGDRRFPRTETLAAVYGRTVNAQEPLSEVLADRFPWCADHADAVRAVFAAYLERKRALAVVDYDDLLLYWRALVTDPEHGRSVRDAFDHVLVDEYQDTNALQADILRALVEGHGQVTVVGDDAQAIYGFRAATADNLAAFAVHHPGTHTVTLEANHRSVQPILDVANDVLAASERHLPKTLRAVRGDGLLPHLVRCRDETAQSGWICDEVLARREEGIDLRDQAVLFRTGHHSDGLELELARRDIPFVKFGGLKFLEAAHVKDMLALLRILDNPRDELAWRRVLVSVEGIGPARAGAIVDDLGVGTGEALHRFCTGLGAPPARAAVGHIDLLRSVLADCAVEPAPPPASQLERLGAWCAEVFPAKYPDAAVRLADLEHLGAVATAYPDRSRFLAEVVLDPPARTSDLAGPPHLDDDYLVLSTIHSAKGGEWRCVYLLSASDGNVPSDMALGEPDGLEEERRLLYVALTRARDHLAVCWPQRYYHRRFGADDAHTYAQPSRFLAGLEHRFDEALAGHDADDASTTGGAQGPDRVRADLTTLFAS